MLFWMHRAWSLLAFCMRFVRDKCADNVLRHIIALDNALDHLWDSAHIACGRGDMGKRWRCPALDAYLVQEYVIGCHNKEFWEEWLSSHPDIFIEEIDPLDYDWEEWCETRPYLQWGMREKWSWWEVRESERMQELQGKTWRQFMEDVGINCDDAGQLVLPSPDRPRRLSHDLEYIVEISSEEEEESVEERKRRKRDYREIYLWERENEIPADGDPLQNAPPDYTSQE
ncbi:hypothetical protein EW146_g5140 [Bondarzewia mesenterica]|uniref:Uncharacterized protein n=1 Tax=Bondarzewia mesenterica TaxID=1095465 RepID=A0A4S4LTF7_9AGAM|nr:hypothetical protein EW146_g5140 [Bondarzewia mesenterica]